MSWTETDRTIVRQAAVCAGKQEVVIARKGLFETDRPLQKEVAALDVTMTQLTAAERAAFATNTRPVYAKWKNQIGAALARNAEKAIAARK